MVDPLWINEGAPGGPPNYDANELRAGLLVPMMYDGRAIGARQGVRPGGTQLQVSLVGSDIIAAPGPCLIDPAWTTEQAPYWVTFPAAVTVDTLDPPDATDPRVDRVWARVYDHDHDASGRREAVLEYEAGVPGVSPVPPTIPQGAMSLARIEVPQDGGGSPVVVDERFWAVASGGILPVAAPGDIVAGVVGRYRHRLDTGTLEVDTGSQWEPVADPKRYARSGLILGQSPGQSIPNGADTDLEWTLVHTNEGFSFTPPDTEIMLPEDGLYAITCSALWTMNATGERRVGLLVDGALWADDGVPAVNGNVTRNNVSLVAPFSAGQVIRAPARQGSGGPLAIQTTSRMPNISVWRIA